SARPLLDLVSEAESRLLAGRVLQVRLMADDDDVLAFRRWRREKLAERLGPTLVLARRYQEAAFGDIDGSRHLADVEQFCRLLSTVELAGDHFADWNLQRPERFAERLRLLAALVRKLPLGLDVVQVQRVGVGLVGVRL